MKKILAQVIDSLNKTAEKKSTKVVFSSPKYKPVLFDKKNFNQITENKNSKQKILFIDGGNASLLESPSFVVEFARIFGCVFQNKKKVASEKKEFFVVVKLEKAADSFFYSAEIFPLDNSRQLRFKLDFLKNSESNSIMQIANDTRRFFELDLAHKMAKNLDEQDIIVLDGTLKTNSENETGFFNELCKTADEKNLILSSISKTTTLFTDSGDSALAYVSRIAEPGKWFYHPVAEINDETHKADMFFVKLHKNSGYVFRFELYKKSKCDYQELFSLLAENSTDPVFLGYPYGLVYADSHARVSNKERDYLKTIFLKNKTLLNYSRSLNAHDVLDSIN